MSSNAQTNLFDGGSAAPPESLPAARQRVYQGIAEGIICPCCDQLCQLYRRKLSAGAIVVLLRVWRRRGLQPVHLAGFLGTEGLSASYYADAKRLCLWGILEEVPDAPVARGARKSGWYRITQLGLDFIEGRVTVPTHVVTYNGVPYGPQPVKQTDIRGALGRRFDYDNLLHGRLPEPGLTDQAS